MSKVNTLDYERVGRENLERTLNRKKFYKILKDGLKSHDKGSVIVVETPVGNYLDANIYSVKSMIDSNYKGVYLSFQRPYKNISSHFEKNKVNLENLFVFDCASVFCDSIKENNPHCVNLSSDFKIEELVEKICLTIKNLDSDNRFIFVDSLSTLAIHKSFSETLKFSEFLINTVKRKGIKNVTFIFNIAKELGSKRYNENINLYADEHIHLGLCT